MQLTNDRYWFYLAEPTVFFPFENDIDIPEGANLNLFTHWYYYYGLSGSSALGLVVNSDGSFSVGNGLTDDTSWYGDKDFTWYYGVNAADGTALVAPTDEDLRDTDLATITLTAMLGAPGLGGETIREVTGTLMGGNGFVAVDLDPIINPMQRYEFDVVAGTATFKYDYKEFDVDTKVDGTRLLINSDEWAHLQSGETGALEINVEVTNGTQTVLNILSAEVSGTQSAGVSTYGVPDAAGVIWGAGTNDQILDKAGQSNVLIGGKGADTFVFQWDYSDDRPSYDTILDYEHADQIRFASEVTYSNIYALQDGVMLLTTAGDVLTIYGEGTDDITYENLYRAGLVTGGGAGDSLDELLFDQYALNIQTQVIYSFGW